MLTQTKNSAFYGYGLAFLAVALFATFELAVDDLLNYFGILSYFTFRVLVMFGFLSIFILLNGNERKVFFSKASPPFEPLQWLRGLCWASSIFFLAMSFFIYDSQALSYGFFLIHPVYTMAFGWIVLRLEKDKEGRREKYSPFAFRTLYPICLMILGALVFGLLNNIEAEVSEITPSNAQVIESSHEVMAYLAPLLAGLFFALSNSFKDYIQAFKQGTNLNITTFTSIVSLVGWPLFIPFLLLSPVSSGWFSYNIEASYCGTAIPRLLFNGQCTNDTEIYVFVLLIVACIVVTIATWIFAAAFSYGNDPGRIASMDMAIVVFAFGFDAVGNKLSNYASGTIWAMVGALVMIVAGAIWSILQEARLKNASSN